MTVLKTEQNERQLQTTITEKDKGITQVLEDMAQTICTNEQTRETCLTDITNTPNYCNKGKTIEEVTPRQARRKMNTFTDYSKQALWFAESFGLVPEYIHLRKAGSVSSVKIALSESHAEQEVRPPDEMDFNKVLQRFAVSDDAYHKLSVVSDLPPLYLLKNTRTSLNSSLDLQRYDGPYQGAYRPFVETLKNKISKVVSTNSYNNYLHVPLITYLVHSEIQITIITFCGQTHPS